MLGDAPPIHLGVPDRNPHADRLRVPTTLPGDSGSKTPIPIHGADKLLDIDQFRFELDDQQRPRRRMEREHITPRSP
jgi:hypothetical protein